MKPDLPVKLNDNININIITIMINITSMNNHRRLTTFTIIISVFFISNNLCCERNMIQNSFDITCSIDLPTWAFHCASYFWRWKLLQQNRNQMGLNNLSYSRMNSICKMWNCPGTQTSHAYPPGHQIYAPKNQRNRIQIISSTIATYFL